MVFEEWTGRQREIWNLHGAEHRNIYSRNQRKSNKVRSTEIFNKPSIMRLSKKLKDINFSQIFADFNANRADYNILIFNDLRKSAINLR